MERRQFLKASVAVPLSLAACDSSDHSNSLTGDSTAPDTRDAWHPAELVELPADYPLGIQCGSMRSDQAILWTYTTQDNEQELWLWTTEGAPSFGGILSPVEGYLKVSIQALKPDTHYSYAWLGVIDKAYLGRSGVGQFRTPPEVGQKPTITLAATACTKNWHAPYDALTVTAKHSFDAFCHLGDMSYNDKASTREEYRSLWHATLQDPGYAAILPRAGSYITWDDHELADNSVRYQLPEEHIQAGMDAWFETLPVPRREDDTFWDSYRWGSTVEIFVLDSRRERQPETRLTSEAIYLGADQLAWLKNALADSPCHFKVLLNSVPIAELPVTWPTEDMWAGYPAQRSELLDFVVNEGIENVWFLSGDLHMGAVNRVAPSGPYREIREIMVGPGASTPNPLVGAVELAPVLAEDTVPSEQFDYYSTEHAATLVTFDPLASTVHVRFISAATEDILFERTYPSAGS